MRKREQLLLWGLSDNSVLEQSKQQL